MENKRGSFSGSLGFVLAAAGSAVGLGNIWRFPYLAAKDGGGIFILTYIILALTFGFALLTTEIAIGRKTGKSPLVAYGILNPKWKWIGPLACLVPMLILPYYCVIGGWILKYLATYLTGHGADAVADGYFTGFITSQVSPIVWFLIFLAATAVVILIGVDKGIERLSRVLMPCLVLLVLIIGIFSVTRSFTDPATGETRTGLQGLAVYLIPNFEGFTFSKFCSVLMDAMGQLFYSISVAMGIMITYGSYVKKEINLGKSVNHIEIFDTAVALLAGMMIIPAVYTFMGRDGLSAAGPSLMFVSLPKVFDAMGGLGAFVAVIFFVMVVFAALTSSVSIMEAITSCFMDQFKLSRRTAGCITFALALILGLVVCLGYNVFYFELTLPNGSVAQVLDVMDYLSNYILMPIVAIATCILVGWVSKPKWVIDEVTVNGESFARRPLYVVMVKFVTPVLLVFLLLQSLGVFHWISSLFAA